MFHCYSISLQRNYTLRLHVRIPIRQLHFSFLYIYSIPIEYTYRVVHVPLLFPIIRTEIGMRRKKIIKTNEKQ